MCNYFIVLYKIRDNKEYSENIPIIYSHYHKNSGTLWNLIENKLRYSLQTNNPSEKKVAYKPGNNGVRYRKKEVDSKIL